MALTRACVPLALAAPGRSSPATRAAGAADRDTEDEQALDEAGLAQPHAVSFTRDEQSGKHPKQ